MRRDSLFELRVLTGTHAGARTPLSAEPQVLGSADDCDLILSDEGVLAQHAQLEHLDDGTTVLRWLDGDLEPLVIRPGQGAALGPVQIAIDHADAPWRTDLDILGAADADGPVEPVLEDDGGSEPPVQTQAEGTAGRGATRAAARRWGVVAAVLALVAALAWWMLARPVPPPAPTAAGGSEAAAPDGEATAAAAAEASGAAAAAPPGSATPAAPAEPVAVPQALADALARLGLGDRVRVEARNGRTPRVHATLLSEEETERLAIVLSRLQPRPGLRVVSLADLQAQVDAAVQDALDSARTAAAGAAAPTQAGAELTPAPAPAPAAPRASGPLPVKAVHQGEGRFRLEGRVSDEATRERIVAQVQAQATDLRGLESALLTDAEAAAALLSDLRAQAVGKVEGDWIAGVLSLAVTLAPAEVPAWERALVAASRRTPVPLRATVQVVTPPPPVLPFKIRSVISSDTPIVMLEDGTRLAVGAVAMGWRVADIQSDTVVFEDPSKRRMVFQR